ncbi:putative resolvase [Arthrobacter globiformis NBRC 12137]|uniref:Putative resolvase n=1 Tax=Arthrobacter globiformis (strain ATCC 8010 / DSM 20124 / JCM 1332 / NBRC 12137 / NCIMB 8907 / NRRL B-2979 / 168) TaxID=1077972 RepID=H0QJS3_ARTG1|nr:putative resolvase [Arthrobacter globiformis NBRC 12137]
MFSDRQRKGIARAKQRSAYKGRQKTLTPDMAAELVQRAANRIPKSVLASQYGIGRETVYPYLRQAKLSCPPTLLAAVRSPYRGARPLPHPGLRP